MPQRTIRPPLFRQLHGCPRQVSVKFLELVFKSREQRERVGRASSESGENLVAEKPPDLFRVVLHHSFAHRDLSVRRHHDMAVLAHAQNRRAVHLVVPVLHRHPAIIPRELLSNQKGILLVTAAFGTDSQATSLRLRGDYRMFAISPSTPTRAHRRTNSIPSAG